MPTDQEQEFFEELQTLCEKYEVGNLFGSRGKVCVIFNKDRDKDKLNNWAVYYTCLYYKTINNFKCFRVHRHTETTEQIKNTKEII